MMLIMGKAMHVRGKGAKGYMGKLYLPLLFTVNFKHCSKKTKF